MAFSDNADLIEEGRPDARCSLSHLQVTRATGVQDVAAVRALVLEYHAESRYAHIPFSERKFNDLVGRAASDSGDSISLYVQLGGQAVGMLHAGVGEYYLGEGGRIATVYALYVSKRARASTLGGRVTVKLIRILSDWAKSMNAVEIHVHATSGIAPARTDRLLKRLGFRPYGGNYVL